jgi:hypothetical protein
MPFEFVIWSYNWAPWPGRPGFLPAFSSADMAGEQNGLL